MSLGRLSLTDDKSGGISGLSLSPNPELAYEITSWQNNHYVLIPSPSQPD